MAKSSTENKNLVTEDYQQVLGELSVCILCICVSLCQYKEEECFFPWSPSSTGQRKKPDSEPSRRPIVGERILCWLCKLKPSKAEQAENQHGLQFVPSAWLVAL